MKYELEIHREGEEISFDTFVQVIQDSDHFTIGPSKIWGDADDPIGVAPITQVGNYAWFKHNEKWQRCIEHTDSEAIRVYANDLDLWNTISQHAKELAKELGAKIEERRKT